MKVDVRNVRSWSGTLGHMALCAALLLFGAAPAHAVSLRIVVTWDSDHPMSVSVQSRNMNYDGDYTKSFRTPGCNELTNRFTNATITSSPQVGRGPIEFVLDPVPAGVDLWVLAWVGYCSGEYDPNLPEPRANATVTVFENSELIYTDTLLVKNMQQGEPGTYGGSKILYRYRLDPWIDFDLVPYAVSGWERMIINAYRTDIPSTLYPSPWQEQTAPGERPRFRVNGRVMTRRGALPDTPIYLRVTDPPDEGDCVVQAGHAVANDNADPEKRGRLERDDGEAGVDGAVLAVTTDASGHFSVTLRGTTRYGGDNYVVEGSADALFSCTSEPMGCGKTAAITAWKRAYIEVSSMFKRSAFITLRQDPAKRTLRVDQQGAELCVGCLARLIHTPNNGGGSGFYFEDAKITAIKKDAKSGHYVVTLDRALSKTFLPPPVNPDIVLPPYFGDAIGIIDPSVFPNGDYYFAANLSYLNQVYPAAFVEYVPLPARMAPVPLIPHVPVMAAGINAGNTGAINRWIDDFSRRWYENAGRPNHQHVVGADRNVDANNFGIAVSVLGLGQAHVLMGKVTGAFGLSAADWRLAGEITVHEMAHNWHVNWDLQPVAHCTGQSIFNRSNLSCTGYAYLNSAFNGTPCSGEVCPEYSDGIVGFHYNNQTRQSEYMYIRHRREPMPFDDTKEP